jgi:hypothetical protein
MKSDHRPSTPAPPINTSATVTGTATQTPLCTPPNTLTAALHPTHVHPLARGVYAAGEYMAKVRIELAPLKRPASAVASGPRESYTRRV